MSNSPEILVNGVNSVGIDTLASISESVDAATVIGHCFA